MKIGGWLNMKLYTSANFRQEPERRGRVCRVRHEKVFRGTSTPRYFFVSVANAAENLEKEITKPFGWSYNAVVANQKKVWNDYLSRITITSDNRLEKVRFYTNFFRSLCRNTWSDVNGEWIAPDETIHKFTNPKHQALGCDAFWNTFWNLNQLWNLVTPEWSSKWVNSQLPVHVTIAAKARRNG